MSIRPSFCTGCPERPVFSALKILRERQPEVGDTHVAADIGCHSFSAMAPFNTGNTILGYGMGLASDNAAGPLFGKRTIAIMGDGGFWHNGLTSGVANAVFNKQDAVLVVLQNFYTSATGQQHNPSTGTNPRREPVALEDRKLREAVLDALMHVAQSCLEIDDVFTHCLEAEVARLDDPRMHRPHGDLIDPLALGL